MFIVAIPQKFTKPDGKPFRKTKEVDGFPVPKKNPNGEPMLMIDGQGRTIAINETEDATFIDMLTAFLNSIFNVVMAKSKDDKDIKPLTNEDSSFLTDIFRAVHVQNGTIELEKLAYEWLERMLRLYGVDVFSGNAYTIYEVVKSATEIAPTRPERKRNK